jgi:hypothetical protein
MGEPLGVAPPSSSRPTSQIGRRDDAIAIAEQFAAVTQAAAPPWLRALVARCRGLTADDETAAQAFEAALIAHAEAPDAFETARTRLLYGARLRRIGQRVKAREQLRGAHDAFAEMDLTAWVLRAADELDATGATSSAGIYRRRAQSWHCAQRRELGL